MAEKMICPHCKSSNEEGDKFCLNCGRPLGGEVTLVLPVDQNPKGDPIQDANGPAQNGVGTHLINTSFLPRPLKAIFGDRFLGNSLIHSDEQQHGYLVTEVVEDENLRIKKCTNPGCGAVHVPLNSESETYCTSCSAPLSSADLNLVLFEAQTQIFGDASRVPELGLTHAGIRVPVAAFCEKVAGEDRFCLVTPYTESFNEIVKRDKIFHWGTILISAFEYLHQNGLTYNGQFDEEAFSLSNGNAVIAGFYHFQMDEEVSEGARIADLQALAGVLNKWLTGRKQFSRDPGLSPTLNRFFETALIPPGFSTAEKLIREFTEALHQKPEPRPVGHKLGRLTDVGIARSLNEDSLLTIQADRFMKSLPHPLGLYVVADGMGGHSAGEVASGTIINTIAEDSFSGLMSSSEKGTPEECCNWIEHAIQRANKAVYDLGKKMNSDMGSTIVMAVADGNTVCIGHVGDSRAYQVNSEAITLLTSDHSLVERLINTGQITREEARTHPQRNVIYRTIGDKDKVEVDTRSLKLYPGDRLLLCSDGLNGMIEDELIWQIVMEEGISPQTACEKLIQAANAAGGDDNSTVVVVEFD